MQDERALPSICAREIQASNPIERENCRRVCECLAAHGAREVTPARPDVTAERRSSNPEATPSPKPRDELAVAIFKMENNDVPRNNHLPQFGHNQFFAQVNRGSETCLKIVFLLDCFEGQKSGQTCTVAHLFNVPLVMRGGRRLQHRE